MEGEDILIARTTGAVSGCVEKMVGGGENCQGGEGEVSSHGVGAGG